MFKISVLGLYRFGSLPPWYFTLHFYARWLFHSLCTSVCVFVWLMHVMLHARNKVQLDVTERNVHMTVHKVLFSATCQDGGIGGIVCTECWYEV